MISDLAVCILYVYFNKYLIALYLISLFFCDNQTKSADTLGHPGSRSHQVQRVQHLAGSQLAGTVQAFNVLSLCISSLFSRKQRTDPVCSLQFTEAKVYQNKLVNIRKEMIMLHEKTTKLKVRGVSLSGKHHGILNASC